MKETNAVSIEYFRNLHRIADPFEWCYFWGENSLLLTYIEANKSVFSKLPEDTYDLLTVLSGIRAMKNIKKRSRDCRR